MTDLETLIAAYREALEQIADEQKIYKGHGDYDIEPALTAVEAQSVARKALASGAGEKAAAVLKAAVAYSKENPRGKWGLVECEMTIHEAVARMQREAE